MYLFKKMTSEEDQTFLKHGNVIKKYLKHFVK